MNPPRRPRPGSPAARAVYGWQEDAACRDIDLARDPFFAPDREQPDREWPDDRDRRERRAKRLCRRCPVVAECLGYALALNVKDGVWGGLNEDERVALRRRRMRQAAAEGVAS